MTSLAPQATVKTCTFNTSSYACYMAFILSSLHRIHAAPIQQALQKNHQWIQVTPNLTKSYADLCWSAIFKYMATTSTHVEQLVNNLPWNIIFSDGCKSLGAKGTWSRGLIDILPMLQSLQWPQDSIVERFVARILTIDDLKLTRIILHWLLLKCLALCLKFTHLHCYIASTTLFHTARHDDANSGRDAQGH